MMDEIEKTVNKYIKGVQAGKILSTDPRHRDPITLNEIPEDDPDREFPTGFGEKRIREYDGLFELLDRIENGQPQKGEK